MGWDVMGGIKQAATWAHDEMDHAVDAAGQAVDSAVHSAEHAVDGARQSIVKFGEDHGGVVGKAMAQQVSDGIGLVEGAGLAVYDAGAGVATLARGAGRLTDPVEWALHPDRNMARLETTGNTLTTMAKLGSPTEWMLHPSDNAQTAKALWNGVTAGYQDAANSGDWSKFAGRAVVDVGSFFIGAGEANVAIKGAEGANAAVHVAEGLNALAHGGEAVGALAKGGEAANAIAHGGEAANVVAHGGEAANAAAHGGEAANVATHGGEAANVAAHGGEGATGAAKLTELTATEGKNSVTWTLDANGQTVSAHGDFKEVFEGAKRSSAENAATSAVGKTGEVDDVGGHIAAHRFMKDQGPVNMFPQNTRFNNSAYKTLENEWAAWVKQGKEVEVQIELKGGTTTRPDRIEVSYVVTDPKTGDILHARAKRFTNDAAQTFDRVPTKDMANAKPLTDNVTGQPLNTRPAEHNGAAH